MAPHAPELPFELEYLWTWFLKLSPRRQSGMGPGPISSEEVNHWCARRRIVFDPFEHDILDRIDELYLQHHYKKEA